MGHVDQLIGIKKDEATVCFQKNIQKNIITYHEKYAWLQVGSAVSPSPVPEMSGGRRGCHPLWLSTGYGVQALGQVTAQRIHPPLQEVEPRAEASPRVCHPLWLSAGYGIQALGQVTTKRIHPALQEVEVKAKASRRGCHPLWLSAGYGVQALGQVTTRRIHPVVQEV